MRKSLPDTNNIIFELFLFCKYFMPVLWALKTFKLGILEPEREQQIRRKGLLFRDLRLPGMQVTVTKPAFNRYLQRV